MSESPNNDNFTSEVIAKNIFNALINQREKLSDKVFRTTVIKRIQDALGYDLSLSTAFYSVAKFHYCKNKIAKT